MSRSRAKGTTWESAVVNYLKHRWPHVERRAMNGAKDRGDIAGIPDWVIECKSAARIELAEWMKELDTEIDNADALYGAVWVKRRGKTAPADGYVVMDGDTFTHLLRKAGY